MTSPSTSWPSNHTIPGPITSIISTFFALADSRGPDAAQKLTNLFTPTAKMVVNKRTISGSAEILKSREGVWNGFTTRRHEIERVYSCNEASDDLLVIGKVSFVLVDGTEVEAGFCGRFVFEGEGEEVRVGHYQAWSDSAELKEAMKRVM